VETIRLTVAQAIVRFLAAQRSTIDGREVPLFPGVFAIFGHGNVTCLGDALEAAGDALPTWRGQNEQTMAMAAVAFAKAKRRRQVMVATTSIGPGALNMVTAAGVAHANRLPLLMFSGDTFASRLNDPVLQQVEHFRDPTITVNDAFRPVTRYWDRITRPEQLLHSLPQAVAVLLDPADCGPVFIGLPQDVQAMAFERIGSAGRERTPTRSRPPRRSFEARRTPCSSRVEGSGTRWPRRSSPASPSAMASRWWRRWPASRR
jgi:3D-(3,5/4)-trihydroxycyclohexane-1,2-dione acylhydrolase (decyclizing)